MSNKILNVKKAHQGGPTGFQEKKEAHPVAIPAGQGYDTATVTAGGYGPQFGARIDSQPARGATGIGEIVVSSWCSALGQVSYELTAFSEDLAAAAPGPAPSHAPVPGVPAPASGPSPAAPAPAAASQGHQGCGGSCCCAVANVANVAIVQIGAMAKMSSDAVTIALAASRSNTDLLEAILRELVDRREPSGNSRPPKGTARG